jgi:hypothetical protein
MMRIVFISCVVLLAVSAHPLSEQAYEEINQVESHKVDTAPDVEVIGDADDMGGTATAKFAVRAEMPPMPKDPVRDPMLAAIADYDESTIIKPDNSPGHSLVDALEGINEEITPAKKKKAPSMTMIGEAYTRHRLAARISNSGGNIQVNLKDIAPELMNTKWTAHVSVPFRIDVHNKFICWPISCIQAKCGKNNGKNLEIARKAQGKIKGKDCRAEVRRFLKAEERKEKRKRALELKMKEQKEKAKAKELSAKEDKAKKKEKADKAHAKKVQAEKDLKKANELRKKERKMKEKAAKEKAAELGAKELADKAKAKEMAVKEKDAKKKEREDKARKEKAGKHAKEAADKTKELNDKKAAAERRAKDHKKAVEAAKKEKETKAAAEAAAKKKAEANKKEKDKKHQAEVDQKRARELGEKEKIAKEKNQKEKVAERAAKEAAAYAMNNPKLECRTDTGHSNKAGIVYARPMDGFTLTGGGMNNKYRTWNSIAAFEEMHPSGNNFRCDTGFGPGQLTCYSRACKTNIGALSCKTTSVRLSKSGVRTAQVPAGYTVVGGGIYNHYRHFNKKAGFEESFPEGNGWRGDMGFGWGDYTVYARGCKAPSGAKLHCTTASTSRGNKHTAHCPAGFTLTGCGINNHHRRWDHLSAFEEAFPESNGCTCDTGIGRGDNTCYARCCKLLTIKEHGKMQAADAKEKNAKKQERSKKDDAEKNVKARAKAEKATKEKNEKQREREQKREAKVEKDSKEAQKKHHARKERADKDKMEKTQKKTCTVTLYEHSHYRGRVEHKQSYCSAHRIDVRFRQYALGGRRRGYEASSVKLSGGCQMVQLWDEDWDRYGARDNINTHHSMANFPNDINDDTSGMSVWSKCRL